MVKHSRKKLPNGINVFTMHVPDAQSVMFTVFVKVGSRYETADVSGISHFLEHVFFKGSQNYPNPVGITSLIDAIGGDFNASTSKESTEFYIKAEKHHFDRIFDVLTDMILFPLFKEEEIEKEKGVVFEEINLYQDNPGSQVESNLESTMWPGLPLGWEILGSRQTVGALTREKIFAYKEKFYVPENIILAISGNFDQKELMQKVRKTWGKMEKVKAPPLAEKNNDRQSKPQLAIDYRQTQQAHLALGFKSFGHDHKNNVPALLLASILGGSMSSRLFMNIREEKGLAYYINASNTNYYHTGNFSIHSGLQIEKTLEALREILAELRRVKSDLVSEPELQRAKDYIKGKMALALEDNHRKLDWIYERFAFTGKIRTFKDMQKQIDKTTTADLQRVANELFVNEKMNLALIGPFRNRRDFEKELYFKKNF